MQISMRQGTTGNSALQINEDGVWNTYYLPGADVIDDGKTVKYLPPKRFYLMKTDTTDLRNPDNYYKLVLPGKIFEVDIDYHGVDGPACGCNINFYLVDGPVSEPGEDGDYYCDAQCFPNKGCCSEFDMNQGNEWVQQITNHACSGKGNYPDHPDWECHKWGQPENKITPSEFGEGSGNTIDSTKPFTFRQEYKVSSDNNLVVDTILIQGDKKVVKTMGPDSELNVMKSVMDKGMVFVTGYWTASDMNWMDGDSCGSEPENCNGNPAYISNFRITTIGGPTPPPPPTSAPTLGSSSPTAAPTVSNCAGAHDQCGGNNWNGATCCVDGWTCAEQNEWYSQCV